MDIEVIIWALSISFIAIVGLIKAYLNDKKITREEIDEIWEKIDNIIPNNENKQ